MLGTMVTNNTYPQQFKSGIGITSQQRREEECKNGLAQFSAPLFTISSARRSQTVFIHTLVLPLHTHTSIRKAKKRQKKLHIALRLDIRIYLIYKNIAYFLTSSAHTEWPHNELDYGLLVQMRKWDGPLVGWSRQAHRTHRCSFVDYTSAFISNIKPVYCFRCGWSVPQDMVYKQKSGIHLLVFTYKKPAYGFSYTKNTCICNNDTSNELWIDQKTHTNYRENDLFILCLADKFKYFSVCDFNCL